MEPLRLPFIKCSKAFPERPLLFHLNVSILGFDVHRQWIPQCDGVAAQYFQIRIVRKFQTNMSPHPSTQSPVT